MLQCDRCVRHSCTNAQKDLLFSGCPSLDKRTLGKPDEVYKGQDFDLTLASHMAIRDGYGWASRVEETMIMATRAGYRKIGVAFCITLADEAHILCEILRDNGFEVVSALCKVGALPRGLLKKSEVEDTVPGMAPALCNPLGQAALLNEAHTNFNIVLGLCVGHDSLFFKHSDAPVTCFAVKDRVTGHSPLAPIYLHRGVFKRVHSLNLLPYKSIADRQQLSNQSDHEAEGVHDEV